MPISIRCPSGHRLQVPRKRAGQWLRCPVCDEPFQAPDDLAETGAASGALCSGSKSAANGAGASRVPGGSASAAPPSSQPGPVGPRPRKIVAVPVAPRTLSAAATTINPVELPAEHNLPDVPRPTTVSPHASAPQSKEANAPSLAAAGGRTKGQEVIESRPLTIVQVPQSGLPVALSVAAPDRGHVVGVSQSGLPVAASPHTIPRGSSRPSLPVEIGAHERPPLVSTTITTRAGLLSGRQHVERSRVVMAIGFALLCLTFLSAIPALRELYLASRLGEVTLAGGWTYLTLTIVLVQAGMAAMMMIMRDWSTAWLAALTTTCVTAWWAIVVALFTFAPADHGLIQYLGLVDPLLQGTALWWSFLMVCLNLLMAYGAGRFAVRWASSARGLALPRSGECQSGQTHRPDKA